MKDFEIIDKDLKIGFSCSLMNISSILELNNILYKSFSYTSFDFIYNENKFTEFGIELEPKDCVSKNNELIIEKNVKSVLRTDYNEYMRIMMNRANYCQMKKLNSEQKSNLHIIKRNFLDEDIQVIVPFDHYYAYEEIKKVSCNIHHFHTAMHKVLLADIDFEKNKAYIIDKFHSYKGEIDLSILEKCMNSQYLEDDYCFILSNLNLENKSIDEGVEDYFIKNINETMNDNIELNGLQYKKNISALRSVKEDISEILINLYSQKKKYAPQFFTEIITPIILQKISFNNLVSYYRKYFKGISIENLLELTANSEELWKRADILCDKCFLAGKLIYEYEEKFKKLFFSIYENDCRVYEIMNNFANKKYF